MNYIKLVLYFCLSLTIGRHAQAETHYIVNKMVTVDDEVFTGTDVKTVLVSPVGFTDVEVDAVLLKNKRIILKNEIRELDLSVLQLGKNPSAIGGSPILLGVPAVNISTQISLSGSNTGGG